MLYGDRSGTWSKLTCACDVCECMGVGGGMCTGHGRGFGPPPWVPWATVPKPSKKYVTGWLEVHMAKRLPSCDRLLLEAVLEELARYLLHPLRHYAKIAAARGLVRGVFAQTGWVRAAVKFVRGGGGVIVEEEGKFAEALVRVCWPVPQKERSAGGTDLEQCVRYVHGVRFTA